MKQKTKELDVDFIGEQNEPLTKKEQLSISIFLQKLKKEKAKAEHKKKKKSSSENKYSTS